MAQSSLDHALQAALDTRRLQSLYRHRELVCSPQQAMLKKNDRELLSFCSNDYLGLANHPKVVEAFTEAAQHYGVGSGASHLVCGHSQEHHALEEELAAFCGRERALLFSTGYMANIGVINALTSREDVIYEDRLNHASLLDGGLLSAGKCVRYHHNDIENLEQQLLRHQGKRKIIAVDGVFSMDGDFADLPALSEIAKKHDAWLMVDDAHGLGCVGQQGLGSAEHFSLSQQDVPILMGTLGKAFGSFGAFVAGSETLIESLIQFSRTYIYTTALPPAVAAATRASLSLIQSEPERRQHLSELIRVFREACASHQLDLMESSTAIQPVMIGDAHKAVNVSKELEHRGFWVSAIRPPTVPQGTARLRVTLTAEHTHAQVTSLALAMAESFNAQ
ncbi:MAG: 8-amino-7-oxononanoate synthase [Agarilytica sp.]